MVVKLFVVTLSLILY